MRKHLWDRDYDYAPVLFFQTSRLYTAAIEQRIISGGIFLTLVLEKLFHWDKLQSK
ncbi:hypothetical protein [Bacillus sp. OTU530]|uniref:hypothetical protein n=1 Tax=Bacillus sp. OTU530 TaxID=3043862 RepID=UPI00313E975D